MPILMMVVEAGEGEGVEVEISALVKRGKGRGRSGNIGIGGSSNVSGLGNHERGRSGNIGIGGSNVSGFGNQDADYDYDNGSISRGRGRGRSGNIGGRGSSSTSGYGNPNADYDNGTHYDANDYEVETSQHVRGSNLPQSIPNHPSQRPMITLYYGDFAEGHITRDIISILKVSFYGSWTSWREDQYQWHTSENAAVYRAWEKVMSSRFSDILGECRREATLRATEDNIKYPHTQETTEALGNGTDEGSGDGTDEAVGSGTREYITRRSKRVADAVEAAMEDEHGPDTSQHPPNDFDLWGKATGEEERITT
ncbi:hypothetical protein Tco_0933829 [Tanacetum coccineum]